MPQPSGRLVLDPIGTPRRHNGTRRHNSATTDVHNSSTQFDGASSDPRQLNHDVSIPPGGLVALIQPHKSTQDYTMLRDSDDPIETNEKQQGYVAVYIDGNSLVPTSSLLNLGTTGGKHLAEVLQDCALDVAQCSSIRNEPLPVTMRIYADTRELAKFSMKAGGVKTESTILEFVYGFSSFHASYDFVDLGSFYDLVDKKIYALFMEHIFDPQCRHMLLGVGKDASVVGVLKTLVAHAQFSTRVTLIDLGSTTEHGALSRCNHVDLSEYFVGPSRRPSTATTAPTSTGSSTQASSSQTSMSREESPAKVDAWSQVARKAAHLPLQEVQHRVSSSQRPREDYVLFNADGHRLDKPMKYDAQKVADMKKLKLCNQHYIGKGCCHYVSGNNNCPHRHDMELTKEDKYWLRVVSRETLCKKHKQCRDPDCIYGHQCPYPKSGKPKECINGARCRFREMHGMKQEVTERIAAVELRRVDQDQ